MLISAPPSDWASLGHRSGHRFEWGPHRFSCKGHPSKLNGPFRRNLIAPNPDSDA